MPDPALKDRLLLVAEAIELAQLAGGWTHPVRIIAVTKSHPVDAVRNVAKAGILDVGENRVPEALEKQAAAADLDLRWHFIGQLQRRKVRDVVGRFALIHSVDRSELARELNTRGTGSEQQAVLVQVNCSGEPQKAGIGPDELLRLLDEIRPLKRVRVEGLMTMAAVNADEARLHRTFGLLRDLRDQAVAAGHGLPELSMGMSDDHSIAIEEGATMIRIGSILFGQRD